MKFAVSEKDKKLLIFLLIAAIPVAYLNLFYWPQGKAISKLKQEIGQYGDAYQINLASKAKVDGMESELKILNQRLKDLRAKFPPVLHYDEVLSLIRNTAKKSGIQVEDFTFDNITEVEDEKSKEQAQVTDTSKDGNAASEGGNIAEVQDDRLKEAFKIFGMVDSLGNKAQEDKGIKKVPEGKGYVLNVSFGASGSYSQLKEFLYNVNTLKNRIAFKSVQIENKENDFLKLKMVLELYGIADRDDGKSTILSEGEWIPQERANKDNIFKPYQGYKGSLSDQESGRGEAENHTLMSELNTYDFSMRVMPYGDHMAPPAVSMVAKNIAASSNILNPPVVYGDSKEEVKAELYIEESNGRFYCKFRTQNEAFPDIGYIEKAEFIPIGDELKILIDSTPRKFKQDSSGVVLNITNLSSRSLLVKVVNEDNAKPRVKINKNDGKIRVEYQ
ncbi:MAG: hypothetical protein N3B21_00115 [Clostridia bacterium]|nr:hypothetical protein [Clostridia bacterium]